MKITEYLRVISLFLHLLKAMKDLEPGKIPILGTGNWFGSKPQTARINACVRPVKEGKARYHILKQQRGSLDAVAFDGTLNGIWGVIREVCGGACGLDRRRWSIIYI